MRKRYWTFRVTVLQVFLLLLLLMGSAILINSYFQTSRVVLKLSQKITQDVVEKVSERTVSYLQEPASLTRLTSSLVNNAPDIVANHEHLWSFMWQPLLMTPQLESFFVADASGNYVQVRRDPKLATRLIDRSHEPVIDRRIYRTPDYQVVEQTAAETEWDPRVRPWYKNTQTTPQYYWTDAYVATTSQRPVIAASYPVVDDHGDKIAVVCVNIPLENLSTFLQKQHISEHGLVFIIDQLHQIVAHPDLDMLVKQDASTGELRLATFGELPQDWVQDVFTMYKATGNFQFTSETAGEAYLVNIANVTYAFDIGWKIVTIIPERDILQDVNRIIMISIAISLTIFFLAIIAVVIISERITKPIAQMASATEKIKDFELEAIQEVDSSIQEIHMMNDALLKAVSGLKSFRKYVPADLVRQLIKTGQEVEIGGESKALTIFFSDIANFTTISETLPAEDLMLHLSEYLDQLSHIIMHNHGTIDKYIGDAIMAFWGAPEPLPNHAFLACRAALRCQQTLQTLQTQWQSQGKPALHTRIGINTGEAIVGNMGSPSRMNYSVIGDMVNLTSRLEGINKLYGTGIIIGEATYREVADRMVCRWLDIVAVKGKNQGIKIYELLAESIEDVPPETLSFCRRYEEGLAAYMQQDWAQALAIFSALRQERNPGDPSIDLFYERCCYYHDHPDSLPPDWDGVTRLHTK